jgi:hypothetical protein
MRGLLGGAGTADGANDGGHDEQTNHDAPTSIRIVAGLEVGTLLEEAEARCPVTK